MTTKCTKFFYCLYLVATYIDNIVNTNTNNPKLVLKKSKRNALTEITLDR